jgi:hypothetical protein
MPYEVVKRGSGYKVKNTLTGKTYSKSPLPYERAVAQKAAIGLHSHLGGGAEDIEGGYRSYHNKGSAHSKRSGASLKKKKRSVVRTYTPKKRKLTKYQLFLKRFAKDLRDEGREVHNFMREAAVAWEHNK